MILKQLKRRLLKNFRSSADQLLDKLNKEKEQTKSVKHEIDKHAKLQTRRDNALNEAPKKKDIWEDF
jgi:hypothetical protein|tara:strand:- start:1796 stop:1996 length:201 start_codon:yes stop_codon:yes gene_type:complete